MSEAVRPPKILFVGETGDPRFELRASRVEQLLVCLERREVLEGNSLGTVG